VHAHAYLNAQENTMTTETTTQECPMTSKPQREHEWLRKLIGEWTVGEMWASGNDEAGEPSENQSSFTGSERVRPLGDLWVICEGQATMPNGQSMNSIMTLGFDPQKGEFVGTFVASAMTHLWVYERGELSKDERTLSLYAEGPSMAPDAKGEMAQYKDVIEFKDDDHRTLTAHVQNEDGTWTQFMQALYRRVK
jgi:hypothetical protein